MRELFEEKGWPGKPLAESKAWWEKNCLLADIALRYLPKLAEAVEKLSGNKTDAEHEYMAVRDELDAILADLRKELEEIGK
jgi:hypothetical protein